MKKIVFIYFFAVVVIAHSQTAFHKNTVVLSLGYGAPDLLKNELLRKLKNSETANAAAGVYGSSLNYTSKGRGPFYLKFEYGILDKMGIGFIIATENTTAAETYRYTLYGNVHVPNSNVPASRVTKREQQNICYGAIFNYHFGKHKKIDPYIGLSLGLTSQRYKESIVNDNPSYYHFSHPEYTEQHFQFYAGATAGIRVFINKYAGLYLEAGYDGWTVAQAGLVFKLPG